MTAETEGTAESPMVQNDRLLTSEDGSELRRPVVVPDFDCEPGAGVIPAIPHRCITPIAEHAAVWRCACGVTWRYNGRSGGWYRLGPILRLIHGVRRVSS